MKKVLLIILDGFGLRKEKKGNAIKLADMPNYNRLWKSYPHTVLNPAGTAVGLPSGFMGSSEVGHMNIGSGRIVDQDLVRINKAIKNKSFFKNKVLLKAIKNVKKKNSALHLTGLLSDGGVHSHINHLFALLKLAKKNNIKKVYVHCFLDGRDVPPKSSIKYVKQLQNRMKKIGLGEISTLMGRYYAMDRDNRWNREHKAYDAMANGKGVVYENSIKAIKDSYKKGITDEFVKPVVIFCSKCNKKHLVKENDSIIFFNFRSDRARQITRAFVQGRFNKFQRKKIINLFFATLTEYDNKIKKAKVAFPPVKIKNTLGELISKKGLRQLRAAETEKYAHVTFFFNAGRERPFKNEDRILVASPKVATYNLKPEMSAYNLTEKVIRRLKDNKYDLVVLNFANPDMVGHTGVLNAAIKALEAVEECLGKIIQVAEKNYNIIITADHGNCEEITGKHKTSHTTNKVPFILISKKRYRLKKGVLGNIAPTVLKLMHIKKPEEMIASLI